MQTDPGRTADERRRICVVVSAPITVAAFLRLHVEALARLHSVTVIGNFRDGDVRDLLPAQVEVIGVPIPRSIDPIADLKALVLLHAILRRGRFDLVQTVTPKAGLIGMLASRLAGVPHRIHWFTGQVWATRRGLARQALRHADKLIAALGTRQLVDSSSQRDFLIEQGVLQAGRATVLADGSISGVDLARFHPDPQARASVRRELGIPDDGLVLLFLGRLGVEKGVLDLARAFRATTSRRDESWLVLVGPDEGGLKDRLRAACAERVDRLRIVDYTSNPARYHQAADVFCLPSYREGFGTSVIEAAACAVPAIGSRIYGLTDAIEEGVTGLLHAAGDTHALRACLDRVLEDAALRSALGSAALERARSRFPAERVTGALVAYYGEILRGSRRA